MARTVSVVAALVLWACGDDGVMAFDAGSVVDAGSDAEVSVVEPVDPVLLPCPLGWTEVAGDPPTCEPHGPDGMEACGSGEAHYSGTPGCERVGPACPPDGLPEPPSDGAALYVRAGAVAGDGTRALPFGTIAEAMGAARAGDVVAVGVGDYDAVVRTRPGVEVRGACVADTRLRSTTAAEAEGVVTVVRGMVEMRDLSIVDSERPGLSATDTSVVHLENVEVQRVRSVGALIVGATVTATGLVIRDMLSDSRSTGGRGLLVQTGSLDGARVVIERAREVGASVVGGDFITLSDAAIVGTLPRELTGDAGRGFEASGGGAAELVRTVVASTREVAVLASDAASQLDLLDSAVLDTLPAADGTIGRALGVQLGASARIERALLSRVADGVVFAGASGTVVDFTDVLLSDASGRPSDGTRGRALNVQDSAGVTATRMRIDRARELGVFVGDGAELSVSDLSITEVAARVCGATDCAEEPMGFGVSAVRTGRATLERFDIREPAMCGVQIALDGALALSEGRIRGTEIGACVQVAGYDLTRLTDRVIYTDNAVNLQATSLPVPEAAD